MSLITGQKAPEFTLQNSEGEKVSLSNLTEGKKAVLLFFPLAFSSVCTDEMCKTRDNMKLFNSLNANVAGISVDSFFTLKEFKKANNLNFQLLSDFNKDVSEQYNAIYDDFFGMKGVSKRAAFVVDQEGVLIYKEILDEAGKMPDFNKIREALS
ncbi:MAG: redoxin domain-containing protein [Balneolaceae bacterium]|nr:redoxin domain-containing protein [Balneolaceae bacterium]MCH8547368.1 redoxin domain-containing protein [Balneolaceae bacterium]